VKEKALQDKPDNSKSATEESFSATDGSLLILSARQAIVNHLRTRESRVPAMTISDSRFEKLMGCFVTLKENDNERSLRGCIGFAEPIHKLSYALPNAAVAAAFEDPRFPPISSEKELNSLLVEVSILTPPVLIKVNSQKELTGKINPGKDGLIMRWTFGSGLLLPQVATEYGWDAEEFLCNLSMKAGAPSDQWLVAETQVFKFQAIVFSESSPGGNVTKIEG